MMCGIDFKMMSLLSLTIYDWSFLYLTYNIILLKLNKPKIENVIKSVIEIH